MLKTALPRAESVLAADLNFRLEMQHPFFPKSPARGPALQILDCLHNYVSQLHRITLQISIHVLPVLWRALTGTVKEPGRSQKWCSVKSEGSTKRLRSMAGSGWLRTEGTPSRVQKDSCRLAWARAASERRVSLLPQGLCVEPHNAGCT